MSSRDQKQPQRPPNCRIFLGNLASEKTSKEELHRIFAKYGEIVEDIVMRQSFGFIQYDNPKSAADAIAAENGRTIGGIRIDINLADNRDHRRDKPKDRDRNRSPPRNQGRRRARSPSPQQDKQKRLNTGKSSQPILCQILYTGPSLRDYASRIERDIETQVGGFGVDTSLIERRSIQDAISRAENQGLRYVGVVTRPNEANGTMSLNILRSSGKSDVYDEVSTRDALEIIRREEKVIATNFLPPHQHYALNAAGLLNQYGQPLQAQPNPLLVPQTTFTQQPVVSPLQNLDANAISRLLASIQQAQTQGYQATTSTQPYVPQPAQPSPAVAGLQSTNLLDPRVQSYVPQPISMQPALGSLAPTSQYTPSLPTFSQGQTPNLGQTAQAPSNIANLLNPRNAEMLSSLLSKISSTSPNTTQSYGQQNPPTQIQGVNLTGVPNISYSQSLQPSGYQMGAKLQPSLYVPQSSQQASMPYNPQQYAPQTYSLPTDQNISNPHSTMFVQSLTDVQTAWKS